MASPDLDAARSLVCVDCWDGLFARENFRGIWENPGALVGNRPQRSFVYTSTWNRISDASSQGGCNWCSLLLSSVSANRAMHHDYSEEKGSFFRTKVIRVRVAFGPPTYAGKVLIGAQLVGA